MSIPSIGLRGENECKSCKGDVNKEKVIIYLSEVPFFLERAVHKLARERKHVVTLSSPCDIARGGIRVRSSVSSSTVFIT